MTETLTLRLDTTTRQRLDALSRRSGRSKSVLAAEAITAYLESEEWQLGEIEAAVADLDAGHSVGHDHVAAWLASWGTPWEKVAPRVE
jgi:predicted transcriptional regulator